ncbi:FIG01058191: hypothetical protein [hydrothermal vent metagenome]|uniref:TIGR02453 family protein n=1 Tax=hydrothermal vent metagenome TaxID=652676 RepID=A0A3B0VR66_9ZZZZ
MSNRYFTPKTFTFLSRLARNNNRDWFHENKPAYEATIRTPALNFITDFSDELMNISSHFTALPKKVGGSLIRVNRDLRFGKDKRPYKTNIGIQFRHEAGKDIHAPGFYVHIENGACFIGVGIWRPDSKTLGKIRDRMVEKPEDWSALIGGEQGELSLLNRESPGAEIFNSPFKLEGDSLITAPRGYAKDHPLIEDLRRKDFIAIAHVSDEFMCSKNLTSQVAQYFSNTSAFMQFLCKAQGVRF